MAEDFTRAGYRALLEALLERGYRVRGYDDVDPARPDLILRHDIDFWPEAALETSAIERDLGVSAIYFMLVGARVYDIDATETKDAIARLQADGHTVALHFDAARYDGDLDSLDRAAAAECATLEQATGRPVPVISFHRPAPALLQHDAPLAGRPHAYQNRYFREIGYCSDSRGKWRFGGPLDNDAVAAGRALQLLTHPIWWAHDDAGDREAALRRLVEVNGPQFAGLIADTVTGYDPVTGTISD